MLLVWTTLGEHGSSQFSLPLTYMTFIASVPFKNLPTPQILKNKSSWTKFHKLLSPSLLSTPYQDFSLMPEISLIRGLILFSVEKHSTCAWDPIPFYPYRKIIPSLSCLFFMFYRWFSSQLVNKLLSHPLNKKQTKKSFQSFSRAGMPIINLLFVNSYFILRCLL